MDDLSRLTSGKMIPAELLKVARRILELYEGKLQIVSADQEWITIQPREITETHLLKKMMEDQKQIFEGNEINRFKVLCPWDYRGGRGVWIRYLGFNRPVKDPGYWWV